MKHYVEPNMSFKSQTTVKYFLKTLSSICESIVFMYLGITVVVSTHQLDPLFIISTLAACLLSRVVGNDFCLFCNKKLGLVTIRNNDQLFILLKK